MPSLSLQLGTFRELRHSSSAVLLALHAPPVFGVKSMDEKRETRCPALEWANSKAAH